MTSTRLSDVELNDSSFLDSLQGDTSFDGSLLDDTGFFTSMNQTPELRRHPKRKGSEREDDTDDSAVKREDADQTTTVKVPKKPGRKPILDEAEPPTKRKAQNRAAQRAFRERKESHLKDLETRVQELTETSEQDKQANARLQTQIARLESELRAYREKSTLKDRIAQLVATTSDHLQQGEDRRLALSASASTHSGASTSPFTLSPHIDGAVLGGASNPQGTPPLMGRTHSPAFLDTYLPLSIPTGHETGTKEVDVARPSVSSQTTTPPDDGANSNSGISRAFRFNSASGSTSSYNDSTTSVPLLHRGSSCDTSPESYATDSPPKVHELVEGGPQKDIQSFLPNVADTGTAFDWLVDQNNGRFDPVLLGDYRESQAAIIGDGDFNNGLFNDHLLYDTTTNFNLDGLFAEQVGEAQASVQQQPTQPTPSQQLLQKVDAQHGDENTSDPMGPLMSLSDPYFERVLKCDKMRAHLEAKGLKDGKFDLDDLCDELKKKAVCEQYAMAQFEKFVDEQRQGEACATHDGESK